MKALEQWLRRCRANPAPLSPWEIGFLADLGCRGKEPTAAQVEVLGHIANRTPPHEIARRLGARIEALALALVGANPTTRRGSEWRFHRKGSLSVVVAGADRGVFFDHEAGIGGDALGFVRHLRQCTTTEAITWARGWLGTTPAPPIEVGTPIGVPAQRQAHDESVRLGVLLRMFLGASERLADTPAGLYLAGREIDLAELGRQPRSLRFAPALWNAETRRHYPALLAAITGGGGELIGLHRTWLGQDADGRWRKAPLESPKKCLGRVAGGAIRLWRGTSGKPLGRAPPGDSVAIGEGIETCLSIAVAVPELRVLCAVSSGNLAKVALPSMISVVILIQDLDGENRASARALQRAVDTYAAQGRIVKIAVPPYGKDFNDTLRGDAP